jgi:hypothetical protein
MAIATERLVLLDPTLGPETRKAALAPRTLGSLDGLTIGFLDNSKLNSDAVLRLMEERLRERWQVGEAVHARKPDASSIAPEDILSMMAARCHAVVVGVGD